jgi:leucyl/phenylalanyl-tRNA--protein transferase
LTAPFPPVEPEPTSWLLDRVRTLPGDDLVAAGADLSPGTLLAAYRRGLFPMGLGTDGGGPVGWWSPDPRGILVPGTLRVRRSLRKALPRFEVRIDHDFATVVRRCANPSREGRWITEDVIAAYTRLHELGWAHSVEAWQDDGLVGGLYGVAIGGLFAGESMFHEVRDASKAALHALDALLSADGDPRRIVDVQWATDHLARLGVVEVSRAEYLERLAGALQAPDLEFVAP